MNKFTSLQNATMFVLGCTVTVNVKVCPGAIYINLSEHNTNPAKYSSNCLKK